MMIGVGYMLTLLYCCASSQEDIWMKWAVSIRTKRQSEFCNGVLVSYRHALTTCECSTHPHFVFPEFLRLKPGHHTVEIRENQKGYQSQPILSFDPHPKCTSSYFVQGFLTYNYAIVTTVMPFEKTEYVHPIELNGLNSIGALGRDSRASCILMGRQEDSKTPFAINVKRKENCSERASEAMGSDPMNFDEKGMLCADFECDSTPAIHPDVNQSLNVSAKKQQKSDSRYETEVVCDGKVVSGAPLICDGTLVGIAGHGLCKLGSVPVIISRIEPTTDIIFSLSLSKASATPQVTLTALAAAVIVRSVQ